MRFILWKDNKHQNMGVRRLVVPIVYYFTTELIPTKNHVGSILEDG